MSDKFIVNKQNEISTLDASEWNQFAEINNFLVSAGITPDGSVLNQIAKGVANYSNASNFFIENGTVNNYTLIANNNFLAPTAYITGMVIRFITANANTTTTPTINLAGLGAKNIKKADGSSVVAGDINGYVELRYDGTQFLLSPLSSALNITSSNKGLTYLNQPITIANNATDTDNDIDFTAGNFQFDDNSGEALASAMTKRLDASWSAGNNGGGLFSGTKQANTWYHCYAIANPTTQVSDFGFYPSSLDVASVLPSGFTKYKYLGSVLTNASGNITPFYYDNIQDCYTWITPSLDFNISSWASMPTTLTSLTLKCPPNKVAIVSISGNCDDVLVNVKQGHSNATEDELGYFGNTGSIASSNTIPRNFVVNSSSQIQFKGINVASAQIQSFYIKTLGFKI